MANEVRRIIMALAVLFEGAPAAPARINAASSAARTPIESGSPPNLRKLEVMARFFEERVGCIEVAICFMQSAFRAKLWVSTRSTATEP
jgi:hypothetical protein